MPYLSFVEHPRASKEVLITSRPAMPQKISSTQKYIVPTAGMNAVKASDDDDEVMDL